MGLIKAITGAAGGVLADQWKEFFYCDALGVDILAVKGEKKTSSRSSNTKGEDNVISNGSGIAVADGQCMIIVDNGKVVEICSEPGQFTWDSSSEPSIFTGNLGDTAIESLKQMLSRFSYGGQAGKDQRVYYFNTKEIMDNKFGTMNPVPFRVIDKNIGLDIDISIKCNGIYSYKLSNPALFYQNVCGNVESAYNRSEIDAQLRGELVAALQPAFAKISALGVRYSELPAHTTELEEALNDALSAKWRDRRGIEIATVAINSATASKEDEDRIKQLQLSAVNRDPTMAAATLVGAQAQAMRDAANNEGGALTGFMGLGMAGQSGGMNAQDLFAMGQKKAETPSPAEDSWKCSCGKVNTGKFCAECGAPKPEAKPADEWICSKCGKANKGSFCAECGAPKPAQEGWKCSCGAVCKGKFCPECGAKKPEKEMLYKCDKCGWEPADPKHPPKFCPQCGDRFDESDIK